MICKRLQNKVAVVTGASQGIGRAIALRLSKEGATIIATYRGNKAGANSLIQEIEDVGGVGISYYANFCDKHGVSSFIGSIIERFGRIDTLVNNAGTIEKSHILDFCEDDFLNSYRTNVMVPLLLTQEVGRHMRSNDINGSIINISSIRSHSAQTGRVAYCCSKAALNMLTKCSALELSAFGIRVNCIEPGLTATGMNADLPDRNPEEWQSRVKKIPLGRAGKSDDYEGIAAYLASDESKWVTGAIINIDGGHSLVNF